MSKYVVVLSVITNAILIMMVVGILPLLLFGAAVFCAGLVWYVGRLLGQMRECVGDLARVNSERANRSLKGLCRRPSVFHREVRSRRGTCRC